MGKRGAFREKPLSSPNPISPQKLLTERTRIRRLEDERMRFLLFNLAQRAGLNSGNVPLQTVDVCAVGRLLFYPDGKVTTRLWSIGVWVPNARGSIFPYANRHTDAMGYTFLGSF